MKFSASDIFVNLNKAALDAVKKTNSALNISNSAFSEDGAFANKTGDYQFAVSSEKEIKKNDAKKAIETYFTVFSGKDSVKGLNDKDIIQKDKTFSILYHIEMLKNLKESKIQFMKNKKTKMIMEAEPKPTFEISPNELVGKLHAAAMDQVEKKYGNVVSLFNTAIDTNQDPPIASLQDGMFKIKLKLTKPSGDKKKDKTTTKDALKEYLTWFAGKDVAKTADKPKFFIFKSKLDKAKEKNADGTQGYTVYFKMNVEKVDAKNNEKKADAEAAKESVYYHFAGNKKIVVECNKLIKMLNTINESKKMKKKYVLKESTETVTEESGKKAGIKDIKTAWTEAGKLTKALKSIDDCKKLFADKKDEINAATKKIQDKKLADAFTSINDKMEKASNVSESELNENAVSDTLLATLKLGLRIILCILWLIAKGFVLGKIVAKCLAKVFDNVGEGLTKYANDKSKKLKDSEDDEISEADGPKESSFIINPSELIGKLHEAAMQAMVKKYGKKCTIVNTAIDEDHKPPLCTTKPGQYKIIVKQLKKGLFGSTKAAREAVRLYLTVFAGESVAKDILKAKFFIFGKSKLEKGKHEGQAGNAAGYSVYYQLDKGETTESMKIQLNGAAKHVVECNELYKKTLPIVEHMPSKSEAMVSAIANDNNVRASKLLEDIIKSKVEERLTTVLSK